MSRAHLTALVVSLALGVVAPRLAAQDTSSAAGQARRDSTSGYKGAGGVDTARGGAADTAGWGGAAKDSSKAGKSGKSHKQKSGKAPAELRDAPGRVDRADTAGAYGATDTTGMGGRHPDTTRVGDTTPARPPEAAGDSTRRSGRSGKASDSAGTAQPSRQPGQNTSPY